MTEIFASKKSKGEYGHLLERVLPDLQGYDEIHILSREDFDALKLTLKKNYSSSEVAPLLGESALLQHLKEETKDDQENLLTLMLAATAISKKQGSYALSVETKDGDEPFRVGFLMMVGNEKENREGLLHPLGMSATDKHNHSVLNKPHIHSDDETDEFVFFHEVGHLVDNLRNGIKELKVDPTLIKLGKELAIVKHPQELSADTYAVSKMSEDNAVAKNILNNRTLSGTWRLVANPDGHFTEPFMKGRILEGVSFDRVIEAGINIQAKANIEIDDIFKANLSAIPQTRLKWIDKDNFGAYCIKLASDTEAALSMWKKLDPKQKKEENGASLKENFMSCAEDSFDYRTQVLSSTRRHFPLGSLERTLLDNYMRAVTDVGLGNVGQEAPLDMSSTPKNNAVPVVMK